VRPRVALAAACLGAAAAVLSGALPAHGVERGAPPPTRIGVRGDEFNLILSRTRVSPGPALIQFQNAGEDPHDLKIKRVGATGERGTGELGPGQVANLPQFRLKRASKYRLWCSLENHVSYGMEATLRVKRRRG
jgi:plastocyanin